MENNIRIEVFDGASTNSVCGARILLQIYENHIVDIWINEGTQTNTKEQIITLWVFLYYAKLKGLIKIQIFGDSRVIIQ